MKIFFLYFYACLVVLIFLKTPAAVDEDLSEVVKKILDLSEILKKNLTELSELSKKIQVSYFESSSIVSNFIQNNENIIQMKVSQF